MATGGQGEGLQGDSSTFGECFIRALKNVVACLIHNSPVSHDFLRLPPGGRPNGLAETRSCSHEQNRPRGTQEREVAIKSSF